MSDRHLTIHFTDASKLKLSFPDQGADKLNMTARVNDLLKNQYLMIEADGALLMFPLANIKYLQAYPAPDPIPANCIAGATILGAP